MRKTLVVIGLVALFVLCSFGAIMSSSNITTGDDVLVSPLGDGGGPPEPGSPTPPILAGDGGGPPEPGDTQSC